MGFRPTYLVVLSSSCQLYSGTGTALFDWIRYARDAFDFSMLIDVGDARNFRLAREFCARQDVRLIPSPPLPALMAQRGYEHYASTYINSIYLDRGALETLKSRFQGPYPPRGVTGGASP
jgi:hypothetical protein